METRHEVLGSLHILIEVNVVEEMLREIERILEWPRIATCKLFQRFSHEEYKIELKSRNLFCKSM